MKRALAILALCASALVAAEPVFTVSAQEFAYAQRIDYILGDGARPFADEDQRRAHLTLALRGNGRIALLGWSALEITAAVSDRDEELAIVATQPDGTATASHDLRTDPVISLPALALPLSRLPIRALTRLGGHLEVRFSRGDPTVQRLPLSALPANQDQAIMGLEGGTLALTAVPAADAPITVRLSRAAFLALQDVVFLDAGGAPLAVRNRRAEWRDDQGQVVYTLKSPAAAPAVAEVRWYAKVESQRVDVALTGIALGCTVPGRDELRGPLPTGAEGF